MWWLKVHPSNQEFLLAADGELSPRRAARLRRHVAACEACRRRLRGVETALAEFADFHEQDPDLSLPPIAGPRALLKARLAELAAMPSPVPSGFLPVRAYVAATLGLCVFLGILMLWSTTHFRRAELALPRHSLTPGSALRLTREQVCAADHENNRDVPPSIQQKVFHEYGIYNAEPRAYEVDYLITPALGGTDDLRNLWPQAYSAAVWNARVKDALEDRLRDLVCAGNLDLATAQHDIAADWIAAYKKYFHTDRPGRTMPMDAPEGQAR